MKSDQKQEAAVLLLQRFAQENGRLPQKSDFNSETVCFIKQKLGPWPRALERAELKVKRGERLAKQDK